MILPALHRVLLTTNQRDLSSACMLAMAKIGQDSRDVRILAAFRHNLDSHDQELRAISALAMGVSGMQDAVDDLVALATDAVPGRRLVNRERVDYRTRSFAAYGLGLLANQSHSLAVKKQAFVALQGILQQEKRGDRNTVVAVINAMGLLNLDQEQSQERYLLESALRELDGFYKEDLGRSRQLIQSHVPPAIAKLLGRGDSALHHYYKQQFLKELFPKKKRPNDIYRSSVLALGQMVMPNRTGKEEDSRYSRELLQYYKQGRESQARYFALIALGQIGGEANRAALLTELAKGSKALEKPWVALALGVYCYKQLEGDLNAAVDETIGRAIAKEFRKVKNPEATAAFAVALGLCKYQDSADDLMAMLGRKKDSDELAGYLCIGLALMDCNKAKDQIHDLVLTSVCRPERLQQAAIALGKLGDKRVANTLAQRLQGKDPNLAKISAISTALAFIGDRRTIMPLKDMLFDEQLTVLSRACAAKALGGVADKERLPWNSKIARNMNYRATVETLTQSNTGVLDIL